MVAHNSFQLLTLYRQGATGATSMKISRTILRSGRRLLRGILGVLAFRRCTTSLFSDADPVEKKESTAGAVCEFIIDEEAHMFKGVSTPGYAPLKLGQILQYHHESPSVRGSTLEIVRKLGWGPHASIWLARTTHGSERLEGRYYTLKVLNRSATRAYVNSTLLEWDHLVSLSQKNEGHPGYAYCAQGLAKLWIDSMHGVHLCIIFEAMGSNLAALQRLLSPARSFSLPVTKRIVKQTLLALDYLHRECKLVHTDLKPDNIFVSFGKRDGIIERYLEESPSETYPPRIELDLSPDPIITVKMQPLPDFGLNSTLSNIEVKLGGYGVSDSIGKRTAGFHVQAETLRAPEVVLEYPWSAPIDIWSLGCLVFEYLTGTQLFELPVFDNPTPERRRFLLVALMENICGPFPLDFIERSSKRSDFFDDKGKLLRRVNLRGLEASLGSLQTLLPGELAAASQFIRKCLTLNPADRPTAQELLEDPWLKYIKL